MKFLLDKYSLRPTKDTMDDFFEDNISSQLISCDSDDSVPSTSKKFKSPNQTKPSKNIYKQRAEEAYIIMKEAVKKTNERDQSATFGEHVANKHRSFSAHTKAVVEHLVANILFNADMGKYESPTQSTTQTSQFPINNLGPICTKKVKVLSPLTINRKNSDLQNIPPNN